MIGGGRGEGGSEGGCGDGGDGEGGGGEGRGKGRPGGESGARGKKNPVVRNGATKLPALLSEANSNVGASSAQVPSSSYHRVSVSPFVSEPMVIWYMGWPLYGPKGGVVTSDAMPMPRCSEPANA